MTKKDVTEQSGECCSSKQCSWTTYFTNPQWVLYGVTIVFGLLLRWIMLDARPYHHDESLHGMYGRYFFDFPEANFYKYDPMLHGPMLYNCMRFIYAMFGDSLWAARTPVCIMGSLFMFMPLLFRRYFNQTSVLILTAAVALSPTMVYWSRFLREDTWVLAGMLFTVYGFTAASSPWKAFFVLFGATIQWCTKESFFVSLAVVIGYLVFEFAFKHFILKENDHLLGKLAKYIATYAWETLIAFAICALVFAWFYSAGFRYPQGIVEGIGKKAIDYWSKHHAMERIKGPFNFHIYVLAWYELPVFIAFVSSIILFYRRASSEIRFIALTVLATIAISWAFTNESTIEENSLWKIFKLKNRLDIIGLFVLLCHAPLVTIHHLLKREHALAATGYFATATFFVYSYLGEKVPWLSVYPLVFLLPYLAMFFESYFKEYPIDYKNYPLQRALLYVGMLFAALGMIFVLERMDSDPKTNEDMVFIGFGAVLIAIALLNEYAQPKFLKGFNVGRWIIGIAALFTLRSAIQTNQLYGGRETEYLSQVHTTYDLAEVAKQIVDDAQNEREGYAPLVFATGEATWPLAWYFRNLRDEYKFQAKPEERSKFTYLFIDWKDNREPGDIPEGYTARKLNLRGWWVPDFRQVTLKKFLRYAVNHVPWGTSGFTYTTFLMAKDRSRFKQ